MKKNKTILITGGLGLIGRKVSEEAMKMGYNVIIGDIKDKKNVKWLSQYPKEKFLYYYFDICDHNSIDHIISEAIDKFGCLEACVNLCYPRVKSWGTSFEEIDINTLAEHFKLQIGSSIILSQRIIKLFLNQGYGNLIHFSSIQGTSAPKFDHYKGTKMTSPIEYSAIKSGIIAITKWLAKYYKNKNIRVNCISPGGIFDGQDKIFLENYRNDCNLKGMLDPEDITGTILFLLSSSSKYINGQNIIVDDGWSL